MGDRGGRQQRSGAHADDGVQYLELLTRQPQRGRRPHSDRCTGINGPGGCRIQYFLVGRCVASSCSCKTKYKKATLARNTLPHLDLSNLAALSPRAMLSGQLLAQTGWAEQHILQQMGGQHRSEMVLCQSRLTRPSSPLASPRSPAISTEKVALCKINSVVLAREFGQLHVPPLS